MKRNDINIVVALVPNAVYYVIAYVTAFSPISSQSTKALEKLPEIINDKFISGASKDANDQSVKLLYRYDMSSAIATKSATQASEPLKNVES